MIWYLENLQRFRDEREALERLATRAAWLVPGEWRMESSLRVVCDADIVTTARTYPITLEYPNHFPHSPPLVVPRGTSERWSSHQYGAGGELCLEYGPDNWHQDITGADMIESAYRLLQGETPAPDQRAVVPTRHATTIGQELRSRRLRLLVTHQLLDVLTTVPDRAIVKGNVIGMYHKEAVVHVTSTIKLLDGTEWSDPTIPEPIRYEGYEYPMLVTRWPQAVDRPSISSAQALMHAIGVGDAFPDPYYVLLVQGTSIHGYRLWNDGQVNAISPIPPPPVSRRLDEGHAALVARRVAVVGGGSLGSKLALMLARAGVGTFLLVDADVMLPENLVRHDLDWRDVGAHKAAAVARRIQLVNPYAKCETRQHLLGGQESSGSIETLISSLSECDLIIDATAEARAFGYLCAAASAGKKPVLWAEVFGGGFGGLVARHRPSLEPDPASMRRSIENWCAERGVAPPPRAIDYETRESGPPMIADDADVTVIASHAARLAIDTLIPRNPSMFPHSVYMIGLAQGWIFNQPFDTRPIDVGPPSTTTDMAVDPQIAEREMALVFELFEKRANAAASTGTDPQAPTA